MKNIKINALANFLVRVFNLAFPLITGTYVARVFGNSEAFGYYNSGNALYALFLPLATFGIYNYGMRQISKVKHDQQKINYFFSSLFYITIITSVLTTVLYIAYVFFIADNYQQLTIYLVFASQILASFLYIEWMNEAMEDYGFILFKTLLIRVLMVVLIFVYVKKPEDILVYTIVMSLVQIINYLISFVWIKRNVRLVKVPLKELAKLILPLLGLMLMANAGTLYTTLDKIFIERTGVVTHVSLYTQGQMIAMTLAGIISGPISVSVPRLGYYIGIQDQEAYQRLVYQGARLFSFFIVPLAFGLFVTGTYASTLYGGPKFVDAGWVTSIFGIRLILWAIEILLANQVIFIHDLETRLTALYFGCGLLNLVFKSLLLALGISDPVIYILTTMLAEGVLILLELMLIRQKSLIAIRPILSPFIKYSLMAIPFLAFYALLSWLRPIDYSLINRDFFLNLLLLIGGCVLYYLLALGFSRDQVFVSVYQSITQRFKRGK